MPTFDILLAILFLVYAVGMWFGYLALRASRAWRETEAALEQLAKEAVEAELASLYDEDTEPTKPNLKSVP